MSNLSLESGQEFPDILDTCIDLVLRGKRSIDDCIKLYPQHPQLREELTLALLTYRLRKQMSMRQAKVDALEHHLRQRVHPRRVLSWDWSPLAKIAAAMAIVLLLTLGGGGTLVIASADDIPGDNFYGVKRFWESLLFLIASLMDNLGDFWLNLAEIRLDEVQQLNARGELQGEHIRDLYVTMAETVNNMSSEAAPLLVAYMTRVEGVLQTVPASQRVDPLYDDISYLAQMVISSNGIPLNPVSIVPPSEVGVTTVTATPTMTLTLTSLPTETFTTTPVPEENATSLPSATPTSSPTLTPTSRLPVTATRTPSPTTTGTIPPTATPSPTSTLTPIPLPTLPLGEVVTLSSGQSSSGGSGTQYGTPGVFDTPPVRDTERAVFATQTAPPPPTSSS